MSSEFNDGSSPDDEIVDEMFVERVVDSTIEPVTEPVMAEVADPLSEFDSVAPLNVDPESLVTDDMLRLHPTSLIFDLISHGRTFLFPALLGLFGAAKGDMTLIIVSVVVFVPSIAFSVFRYFTYLYCIRDNHLVVRQGMIFRNVRTVPVSRIQNIDFIQNPLHRIMNVAEVRVETASGTKPEATLRVLSMVEMESLRTAVFKSREDLDAPQVSATEDMIRTTNALPAFSASPQSSIARADEGHSLLKIPVSWLLKAGMASNRGLIMVGLAVGAYFQFSGDEYNINWEWFGQFIPYNASTLVIVMGVVGAVLTCLILLRLLGTAWFVLRFFGYELVRYGDDLRIGCGLFTKVSATVPRQRIQFISIHENLIMRWLGLVSIRIETAGGAGQGSENATESVSKRWFIPVVPTESVSQLLGEIRPGLVWEESEIEFKPLHARAGARLCRLAIIGSLATTVIGLFFSLAWGWIAGVLVLPLLLAWAIKKGKAMRYARTENGVIYRSGIFTRKTSMTFFEKIQTLTVGQTPFDRRWKMATLSVDTAAAGPAEHRIKIPFLDQDFAKQELQLLRIKTGQEQPVFG